MGNIITFASNGTLQKLISGAKRSLVLILSASRSTDVPAFYAKWFVERLREGRCSWKNPFNGEVRKVSFDKTRMIDRPGKRQASESL